LFAKEVSQWRTVIGISFITLALIVLGKQVWESGLYLQTLSIAIVLILMGTVLIANWVPRSIIIGILLATGTAVLVTTLPTIIETIASRQPVEKTLAPGTHFIITITENSPDEAPVNYALITVAYSNGEVQTRHTSAVGVAEFISPEGATDRVYVRVTKNGYDSKSMKDVFLSETLNQPFGLKIEINDCWDLFCAE
jgi:hypothetical protein